MADIESKYTLDISGVLSALDQIDTRLGSQEKILEKVAKIDPFQQAAKGAVNLDKELSDGVKTYARTEQAIKDLKDELKGFAAEQAKVNKSQKEFVAAGKYNKVKSELSQVKDELKKVNKELENSSKRAKEASG